jgi:hypothetical protein
VVAVKGFNEPHGEGSDWKKFADFSSRLANSIHAKHPNIMFFMTGISPKEVEKET